MATIDELRSENERLTRELDLQNSEIINSAKFGLGLLEEKQSLQSKCEELENLYENTKHELEITQEVKFYAINLSSHSHTPLHFTIFSFSSFLYIQNSLHFISFNLTQPKLCVLSHYINFFSFPC